MPRNFALTARPILIGVLFAGLVASLAGCSQKSEVSRIKLGLPDWNTERAAAAYTQSKVQALALATGQSTRTQMTRLMINLSGPGVGSKQLVIWESNDRLGASPNPSDLEFEIQSNSTALIQVMAITSDYTIEDATGRVVSRGDNEIFYYGDVDQPIVPGTQDVTLTVRPLNFGSGRQGEIAGRYLTSGGASENGPTGKVWMKYHPLLRPQNPIVLMETEIHGGWFNFFGMEQAGFTYWLEDGTQLFPGSMATTDKLPSIPQSPAVADQIRAQLPQGFKSYGGTSSRNQQDARFLIAGFFGPGVSGKTVCFNSSEANFGGSFFQALTGGSLLLWRGNVSGASLTAADGGVLYGGAGLGTGGCTSPKASFKDYLALNENAWLDKNPALDFKGPFRSITGDANHRLLSVKPSTTSTTSLDVAWQMLPGTLGSERVDSVGVFTRLLDTAPQNGGDRDYKSDDQIKCDQLPSLGFKEVQRISTLTDSAVSQTTITGHDVDAFNEGRVDVIVCAHGSKGYYRSGLAYRHYNDVKPAQYLQAELFNAKVGPTSGTPTKMIAGACTPVFITAFDPTGAVGYLPASLSNFTVTLNGSSYSTYSDATCTTQYVSAGSATTFNLPAGNPQILFIKSYASTTSEIEIAGGGLTSAKLYFDTQPSAATKILSHTSTLKRSYNCNRITYQAVNNDNFSAVPSGTLNFELPTSTGLTFYSDYDCQNAITASISPFNSGSYRTSFEVSYRYTGSPGTLNFAPRNLSDMTITAPPQGVRLIAPTAPVKVSLMIPQSLTVHTCQRMEVYLADQGGYRAPFNLSATPVLLGVGLIGGVAGGTFHESVTDCSADLNAKTSFSVPALSSSIFIYFKPSATAATLPLTATPNTSPTTLSSSTLDVVVNP